MSRKMGHYVVFGILLVLFTYAFLVNAWVVDDAYITFRTVDNFVNGYGLTWNVAERVQAYSHPMWMFLISLCYWVTSDVFYTSLAVSYALCLAALLIAGGSLAKEAPWKPGLLLLALLASKAFMDYTSSGLETPLSYLLAVLFYARFFRATRGETPGDGSPANSAPFRPMRIDELTRGDLFYLFFIAALAFFNRQDTVLLYAPALLGLIWVHAPKLRGGLLGLILVATLPATLELLFSLFYYGSIFPNTAYAKMLGPGLPLAERLSRGAQYYVNSVKWDAASHVMVLTALVLALRTKRATPLLALAGVVAYLFYIFTTAASATHMSGRFFAVPFLVAFMVLGRVTRSGWLAAGLAVFLVAFILWSPVSAVKMGTKFYRTPLQRASCIDAKWYAYHEGAGLLSREWGVPLPDHEWFHAGRQFREHSTTVHVGGVFGAEPIGYFSFAAGPEKHIIDYLGLGDPLLARLPACNRSAWKSGHFWRVIPQGYVESVVESRNLLVDPSLRQYYDVLRKITRGSLFDPERLGEIIRLNFGYYDHLLETYARETARTVPEADCARRIMRLRGPVYRGTGGYPDA